MSNEFSSYYFKVNNALKKNIMGKRKKETFFKKGFSYGFRKKLYLTVKSLATAQPITTKTKTNGRNR